jgi:hypothetical protein
MRLKMTQRGQAAVETALVMPLNVFLILAIIQYGLLSQARIMAKYAAYRAVRVGAMQHADPTRMQAAALATLLPVIAVPNYLTSTNNNVSGAEVILPTDTSAHYATKLAMLEVADDIMPAGLKTVKVVVCGPLDSDLDGVGSRAKPEGDKQVDFDDPQASTENGATLSKTDIGPLNKFLATKLRIQVQFNYRMPIPFANWIISQIYLGLSFTDTLRMGNTESDNPVQDNWHNGGMDDEWMNLLTAYGMKIYIVPISVGYAMRMQSDFPSDRASVSSNTCKHYTPHS